MRLDKFLKVSRLIKRRTLAKEVAVQGRIEINGKIAKASTTVKVGDELSIRFGQKIVTARVEEIQENSPAAKADLKQGDIITAINNNPVKTISELNKIKYTYNVGDKISLTLTREGKEMNIELVLTEETEETKKSNSNSSKQNQDQNFNFGDFFNQW